MNRLDTTLAALKSQNRSGLVCYFTAGDPDFDASLNLLGALAEAGADVIELGMPFSDPVADGPSIQAAHLRALGSGQTVARTLELVQALRSRDATTPLVLMGYLNPVMQFGAEHFMQQAALAGVDGLILVDLPLEHDASYRQAARQAGIHLIRMTAPNSDDARLAQLLADASGFVYHVTLNGTTGASAKSATDVAQAVARVRRHTDLPIAAGFGIRTAEQVRALSGVVDLIVVGSRLVDVNADLGAKAALAEVANLAQALQA